MAEMKKIFAVIGLFALSFVCHADGTLYKVPTREGITTTALVAVDNDYYVRVLGLGGSSSDQRTAALALATSVAASAKAIK